MQDLFQRFCSFRRVMKVLPESGQRGQTLHVEHVSLVLLEHQSLHQKRWQHHQNTFLQYCQPEDFFVWYTWQVLNMYSQYLLSLKAQCPKSIQQECHLPPNNKKTGNSSTAVISVHSSAMTLKTDAFWSLFKIDSSTHVPSASIRSTTAPWEVYTAFLEAFQRKLAIL